MKCECEHTAKVSSDMKNKYDIETEWPFVNHKPNQCKCVNDLAQYKCSDNSVKWLCSCCTSFGDVRITQ